VKNGGRGINFEIITLSTGVCRVGKAPNKPSVLHVVLEIKTRTYLQLRQNEEGS